MSKSTWSSRPCPRCNAQPGTDCSTPSGKRAGLPHRERWPEGPKRTKTTAQRERMRELARKRELERRLAERAVRRRREARRRVRSLPTDDALKVSTRDIMREWRESRVA